MQQGRTSRHLAGLALAAAVAASSAPSHAGIVNVQSIMATEAEEGLSGSITGAADWRSGNSERLTLSLAPVGRYRHGAHRLIGVVRGDLFRARDGTFDRKTFEHIRYRYSWSKRLLGEVFVQHEFNEARRLNLRALIGIGPKYQLLDKDTVRVGVGVAYMLEHERLQDEWKIDEDADDGDNTVLNHRISSYLTASYELDNNRLQLVQTLYAQPLLTDPGDIRLLSESQVVVKLTDSVSMTTSFVLALDAKPPEQDSTVVEGRLDVESTDTTLKTSLTYSF